MHPSTGSVNKNNKPRFMPDKILSFDANYSIKNCRMTRDFNHARQEFWTGVNAIQSINSMIFLIIVSFFVCIAGGFMVKSEQ